MQNQLIIIGAGASGLAAAVAAARGGAQVLLIEQKNSIGKKILATGNGRCNYTNLKMNTECFRSTHGAALVDAVLKAYSAEKIIDFFKTLGVYPWVREGYVYPASMQASTMVHVFEQALEHLGVQMITDTKVTAIEKKNHSFYVQTTNGSYVAANVILATGGKASAALGSDGSGYPFAKTFGHHIVMPVPALCGLKCQGRFFKAIAGVRTHGTVTLYVSADDKTAEENGHVSSKIKDCEHIKNAQYLADQSEKMHEQRVASKTINHSIKTASDTGELQMTAYGISGIPVFQVSRYAASALQQGKTVIAEIDFMSEWTEDDLRTFLQARQKTLFYKTSLQFLEGLLNEKLLPLILKASAIDENLSVQQLSEAQIDRLCDRLKHFKMNVDAVNDFDSAQVCAGGVDVGEVDIHTMMSNYCEGLYLTGELLDVDGMCGGYNLHFAWATGLMAGEAAAKAVREVRQHGEKPKGKQKEKNREKQSVSHQLTRGKNKGGRR